MRFASLFLASVLSFSLSACGAPIAPEVGTDAHGLQRQPGHEVQSWQGLTASAARRNIKMTFRPDNLNADCRYLEVETGAVGLTLRELDSAIESIQEIQIKAEGGYMDENCSYNEALRRRNVSTAYAALKRVQELRSKLLLKEICSKP